MLKQATSTTLLVLLSIRLLCASLVQGCSGLASSKAAFLEASKVGYLHGRCRDAAWLSHDMCPRMLPVLLLAGV